MILDLKSDKLEEFQIGEVKIDNQIKFLARGMLLIT